MDIRVAKHYMLSENLIVMQGSFFSVAVGDLALELHSRQKPARLKNFTSDVTVMLEVLRWRHLPRFI